MHGARGVDVELLAGAAVRCAYGVRVGHEVVAELRHRRLEGLQRGSKNGRSRAQMVDFHLLAGQRDDRGPGIGRDAGGLVARGRISERNMEPRDSCRGQRPEQARSVFSFTAAARSAPAGVR